MDEALAAEIAEAYMRWGVDGDTAIKDLCAPDFHDNVSGQTGPHIFDVVTGWLDSSFSGRRVEHHATMTDGDRVLVWYTQYGTHIGNGFPRMAGLPVTGAEVGWTQVHVLRVKDGKAVEHWAVRDDFAMLEQIKSHQDV